MNRRSFLAALAVAPAAAQTVPARVKQLRPDAPAFTLLPHQQALLDSTEHEVLVTGGRGSGMSFGVRRWLEQGGFGLLVVADRRSLPAGSWGTPDDWPLNRRSIGHGKVMASTVGEVMSRHFDYVAAYDRIAFDVDAGARELPRRDYERLLKFWSGKRYLIATPPPENGMKHWLAKRFFNQLGRRVISATIAQNPHLYGDLRYRNMLECQDDVTRRLWLDGDWRA